MRHFRQLLFLSGFFAFVSGCGSTSVGTESGKVAAPGNPPITSTPTMPPPASSTGDTVTGTASAAQEVFDKLSAIGIDLTDVFLVLEDEGVEKFEGSWKELLDATQEQLNSASK